MKTYQASELEAGKIYRHDGDLVAILKRDENGAVERYWGTSRYVEAFKAELDELLNDPVFRNSPSLTSSDFMNILASFEYVCDIPDFQKPKLKGHELKPGFIYKFVEHDGKVDYVAVFDLDSDIGRMWGSVRGLNTPEALAQEVRRSNLQHMGLKATISFFGLYGFEEVCRWDEELQPANSDDPFPLLVIRENVHEWEDEPGVWCTAKVLHIRDGAALKDFEEQFKVQDVLAAIEAEGQYTDERFIIIPLDI